MGESISEMRLSQIATLLAPKPTKVADDGEGSAPLEVASIQKSKLSGGGTDGAILHLAEFLKLKKKVRTHPLVSKYLSVKNPKQYCGQLIDRLI